MTEQEYADDFLAELLQAPAAAAPNARHARPRPRGLSARRQAPISRHQERSLLREANSAGPVTLLAGEETTTEASFGAEAAEVIRRHPLPTLLAAVGVGYLIGGRRRRR